MNTLRYGKVLGMVSMVLALAGTSLALELPDGLTHQPEISEEAYVQAYKQFETVKQALEQMLPMMQDPAQKAAIQQSIAVVDEKLQNLQKVDVYFVEEESEGAAYDSIHAHFQGILSGFEDIKQEEILYAVSSAPQGLIPQTTINSLNQLTQPESGYEVKAAVGMAGKEKVSILTVYIQPTTLELYKGTTVVVATMK